MLFNSLDFAIFLPIVFTFYWLLNNKNVKFQNILIVIASYFFYGWWDWRFLFLILISTLIDYSVGLQLVKSKKQNNRLVFLWCSLLFNLGILGVFKYYNFFLDNFIEAFSFFGYPIQGRYLNIVLPVGISFYTFQTLSYTIDVYRGKLNPTTNFIAFSAFVSFFPQLVAGPIERAKNLLPQFYNKRHFVYVKAVDGLRQILWGLFKKVVIADNCAVYSNEIFNNSDNLNGSTMVLGAVFFTFQIYGDFSGYSDIAIGTARLFGFKLSKNFAFPYFSRDIAEFWRRWHISLSTWFRDYVYIPLGGSRVSKSKAVFNTIIVFLVSGFWHGANWTFIVWGLLNALYFIPLLITQKNRRHLDVVAHGKSSPSVSDFIKMSFTFMLTVFAWIFFRAENISHAAQILQSIFSLSLFKLPYFPDGTQAIPTIILIIIFILIEWRGRQDEYALEIFLLKWKRPLRLAFYYLLVFALFWFGGNEQQFIYFQF